MILMFGNKTVVLCTQVTSCDSRITAGILNLIAEEVRVIMSTAIVRGYTSTLRIRVRLARGW